jgi:hypothetical protein
MPELNSGFEPSLKAERAHILKKAGIFAGAVHQSIVVQLFVAPEGVDYQALVPDVVYLALRGGKSLNQIAPYTGEAKARAQNLYATMRRLGCLKIHKVYDALRRLPL